MVHIQEADYAPPCPVWSSLWVPGYPEGQDLLLVLAFLEDLLLPEPKRSNMKTLVRRKSAYSQVIIYLFSRISFLAFLTTRARFPLRRKINDDETTVQPQRLDGKWGG